MIDDIILWKGHESLTIVFNKFNSFEILALFDSISIDEKRNLWTRSVYFHFTFFLAWSTAAFLFVQVLTATRSWYVKMKEQQKPKMWKWKSWRKIERRKKAKLLWKPSRKISWLNKLEPVLKSYWRKHGF